MRRFVNWWRNPWGKPRFLAVFTFGYLIWSIIPILIAVRFSFNDGWSRSTGQGWSTRLVLGRAGPIHKNDPSLREALFQSLELASLTMLIAVPIGVASRFRSPLARAWVGHRAFRGLFPIVTPELVMGTALFLTFVHLFQFVELGTVAQLLGHVTFSISFVVIIVRGRLLSIGPEYEEAATDPCAAHEGAPARPHAVAPARDRGESLHRFRHLDRRLRHQPIPLR